MNITSYSVEAVKDPFGILSGTRYEFILDFEVDEDDELYSGNGLYIRAIYRVEEGRSGLAKYELYERSTDKYLDFELEEEELGEVEAFCRDHLE